MGESPEPYLEATLTSLAPIVDVLVVNDNSGVDRSVNQMTIERSAFAGDGRLHVFRHGFRGFDAMRNDAFDDLKSVATPDWIAFVDADEVHGVQVADIVKNVLPKLGPEVSRLDGYTFHFWGTFGWISDIARRMMFYRYNPGLYWEHSVHEQLRGLGGKAVVIPYIYHHYGNVLPPSLLATKHRRYFDYGNPVPEPPNSADATIAVYLDRARTARPYTGPHPAAAQALIERLRTENAALFAEIDARVRAERPKAARLAGALIGLNEDMRVAARAIEHPGLYRGPRVAR